MKLNLNKIPSNIVLILLSLTAWIIPSLSLSFAVYLLTNHFIVPFLINLGIVYLIGYIMDLFFKYKTQNKILKFEIDTKTLELQQSVEVSCAYCKVINVIPVKLNIRNTFECNSCKQINLMIFQFATAQVTTPLETNLLGANNNGNS